MHQFFSQNDKWFQTSDPLCFAGKICFSVSLVPFCKLSPWVFIFCILFCSCTPNVSHKIMFQNYQCISRSVRSIISLVTCWKSLYINTLHKMHVKPCNLQTWYKQIYKTKMRSANNWKNIWKRNFIYVFILDFYPTHPQGTLSGLQKE